MINRIKEIVSRKRDRISKLKGIYDIYEGQELGASQIQTMLNFNFPVEGTPDMVNLINEAGLSDRTKIRTKGKNTRVIILPKKEEGKEKKEKMGDDMDSTMNNSIFIVHGKDELMVEKIKNIISKLRLEPIILREKPQGGTRALIEKFKQYSDVKTAVVLLSSDDECYNKEATSYKTRARQNVLFELGFFCGKLGMNKVITILKKDKNFEYPSDILGTTYIDFNRDNWPYELAKELQIIFEGSGIEIDKNLI